MPWHNGMTCAQYDARKPEERERDKRVEGKDYGKMFGKGVKPCPNCRSPIQKKGGCDHMSCKPSSLMTARGRFLFCFFFKVGATLADETT